MATIPDGEVLEVLACDIAARPPAPGPHELLPFVSAVVFGGDSLLVHFYAAGADAFAAFVDAERQCCRDIGWELTADPALRISATPGQLAAMASLFDSQAPK